MTNAILRASGQVCIAIKRIYVHASRFNELTEKLGESFDRVVVGDGLVPETTMGPLNNKTQFDFVTGLVDKSAQKNLRVITKGKKSPSSWGEGYFMLPSIPRCERRDEIVRCEQFGPVIYHALRKRDDGFRAQNNTVWRCASVVPKIAHAEVWRIGLKPARILNNANIQDCTSNSGIQSVFSRESFGRSDHYPDMASRNKNRMLYSSDGGIMG
jgi:hypothetical protein